MHVDDIMSAPAVTIGPTATLREAVGEMLEHRIGSVVVVDPGVVGILTRSDALRTEYHAGTSLSELRARDAMSDDVVTTTRTTAVDTALETMAENGIKKLPVIDGIDLVGIVTMTDIARSQPDRVRQVRRSLERRDRWSV